LPPCRWWMKDTTFFFFFFGGDGGTGFQLRDSCLLGRHGVTILCKKPDLNDSSADLHGGMLVPDSKGPPGREENQRGAYTSR
jgi:hypothetical protein